MRRPNVGWFGFFVLVAMLAVAWPANSFAQAQAAQTGTALKPEAIAGKYEGTASTPDGDIAVKADLKAEQGMLTGTIDSAQGPVLITGSTITGDRVVLTIDMGGAPGTITGTIKGDRFEGTWTLGDASGTVTLTKVTGDAAKAAAEKPPAAEATPAKPAAAASADPISGVWDGVTGTDQMSTPFVLTLKLEDEKVTGEISSDQGGTQLIPGAWKDGTLTISFVFGDMGTITMVGAIKEGKLIGTLDIAGQFQMSWAAVKRGT
jgi:hypothetical protein